MIHYPRVSCTPFAALILLVGRDLEHPSLAPILARLPNDVGFKAEEGGVVLSVNDNGTEAEYSAVELVAMILSSAQVCSPYWFVY